MTVFNKADWRRISTHLGRLLPPGGRELTLEEIVDIGELRAKLQQTVEADRPREETGDCVLEWRIPNEWTAIKSGKGKPKWMLGQLKNKLGDDLRKKLPAFKSADLVCARRRRWVQVRRFSDKKPDRPHCPDCLGARQAIDVLKDLGIIVDDNTDWTVDDTDWIACKRGQTHIVIRVFEVETDGRCWAEPECVPPPRPGKHRGLMTGAVVESSEHLEPSIQPTTLLGTPRRRRAPPGRKAAAR